MKTIEEVRISFTKNQYLSEYQNRMALLGKDFLITVNGEKINARAIKIYSDGGLEIKKGNGDIEKIYAGEVNC